MIFAQQSINIFTNDSPFSKSSIQSKKNYDLTANALVVNADRYFYGEQICILWKTPSIYYTSTKYMILLSNIRIKKRLALHQFYFFYSEIIYELLKRRLPLVFPHSLYA